VDFVWTKGASLVFVACFGKAKAQSTSSIRARDQTDQLSSLRFAFYTAGAGQKDLGCLSRDCHGPVRGFTTVRGDYSRHHVTYSREAPTAAYMWLYTTLKGDV